MAEKITRCVVRATLAALLMAITYFAFFDWPRTITIMQEIAANDSPAPLYFQFVRECGTSDNAICREAIERHYKEMYPTSDAFCGIESYWSASAKRLDADPSLADFDWRDGVRHVLASDDAC